VHHARTSINEYNLSTVLDMHVPCAEQTLSLARLAHLLSAVPVFRPAPVPEVQSHIVHRPHFSTGKQNSLVCSTLSMQPAVFK